MKKYAVFTESKFMPTHELSLSNRIVEEEDILTVLEIVRDWINKIDTDCIVYFRGNTEDATIQSITVRKISNVEKVGLTVYCKESNVRFRFGTFETAYVIKEVK